MTRLFDAPPDGAIRVAGLAAVLEFVPLGQCLVDRDLYQRGELAANVKRLVAGYIHDLVPCARGTRRSSGLISLSDGGHRAAVAALLGHGYLPVLVDAVTLAEEAHAFVAQNSGAKDSSFNSYRAHVYSGHKAAYLDVQEVLEDLGLVVTMDASGVRGGFCAVATAMAIYRRGCGSAGDRRAGQAHLRAVLELARDTWPQDFRALNSFMLGTLERFLLLWGDEPFDWRLFVHTAGEASLDVLCAHGFSRGRFHGGERHHWVLKELVRRYNNGCPRTGLRLDVTRLQARVGGARARRRATREEKDGHED